MCCFWAVEFCLQRCLRCWAFFILDRFAEVLGVEELKSRLSRAWCANSFFSGIDCVKHAWAFITAASVEMFGISPGVDFALSVWASLVSVITKPLSENNLNPYCCTVTICQGRNRQRVPGVLAAVVQWWLHFWRHHGVNHKQDPRRSAHGTFGGEIQEEGVLHPTQQTVFVGSVQEVWYYWCPGGTMSTLLQETQTQIFTFTHMSINMFTIMFFKPSFDPPLAVCVCLGKDGQEGRVQEHQTEPGAQCRNKSHESHGLQHPWECAGVWSGQGSVWSCKTLS